MAFHRLKSFRFRPSRAARVLLVLVLLGAPSLSDVFVLADGRRIQGVLMRETADTYVVQTGLGELKLARSEVVEILSGQTDREVFDERWEKTTTAPGFFELGNWASRKRLRSLAHKAWKKALELDADHAGAHRGLGHVLYKGEWMTPDERDRRAAADEAAEMGARGLVKYEDRWVTHEEKQHLVAGRVFHEGEWVTPDERMRRMGFELWRGEWRPREEVVAREHADRVSAIAGVPLSVVLTSDALVAGDYAESYLADLGGGLEEGRRWFDGAFAAPPGLELFGGQRAELYVWGRDERVFVGTVDHFASLTDTVPDGWAVKIKSTHGLYWIDPYPLSSARVWHRPDEDLIGHNYHHWGHLLLGRLGYDGRLLPPWYDEAVAGVLEFRVHGRNAVFCRARGGTKDGGGTSASGTGASYSFDPNLFRKGGWKDALVKALEREQVPSFDRLSQKQFSDLELMDVAAGMAIVEWLESRRALPAFHGVVRETSPASPRRIIASSHERQAAHDRAFEAALGLKWRDADREWRAWVLGG